MTVPIRMIFEILLMLVLCTIKIHDRPHFDRNRLSDMFLQCVKGLPYHTGINTLAAICIRHIIDTRAVLPSDIVALPIDRRRIDGVIKRCQKLLERNDVRIIDNVNCLHMPAAAAYFRIGRMCAHAVCITALRRDNTRHKTEIEFRPPEAAAGEIDLPLSAHRDILLYDFMRHLRRGRIRRTAAAKTDERAERTNIAQ